MQDDSRHEIEDGRPGGPARQPIPIATVVSDASRSGPARRALIAVADFLPPIAYFCLQLIKLAAIVIVTIGLFAIFILGFVCTVR